MTNKLPKLYDELARIWPIISPLEDSGPEAEMILRIIEEQIGQPLKGQKRCLLELGAGVGHTLYHLAGEFQTVAVDRSPRMLGISRKLNSTVTHVEADFRDLNLSRSFDVVLAHDSLDYMVTEQDLRAAITSAAQHLQPGGLLIAAPTYFRETFKDHEVAYDCCVQSDIEVSYVSHVRQTSETSYVLTMLIIIHEHGELRVEEDRHFCGLYEMAKWRDILDDAGLDGQLICDNDESSPWQLWAAIKR